VKVTTVKLADGTYDYKLDGVRGGVSTITPWGARYQGQRAATLKAQEDKAVKIKFETMRCTNCSGAGRFSDGYRCHLCQGRKVVLTGDGFKARTAYSAKIYEGMTGAERRKIIREITDAFPVGATLVE
jgi:hypothetical protein